MQRFTLPLALVAGLGLTAPVSAQNLEDVIGGIAQSLIQQELDKNAYIAAQEANTVAAYRDYLAKFPKGAYRANAERALERLGATARRPRRPRPRRGCGSRSRSGWRCSVS